MQLENHSRMTPRDPDSRAAPPSSGRAHLAFALRYNLNWRIVQPTLWKLRRLRNSLSGHYTSATIPVEWPASPLRTDFINEVVARNAVQSYLEIGCRDDECFSQIRAPHRVGVDPMSGGTVRATSDEFFASNHERFDLIFIDGLHLYEQVLRDIRNSLAALNPGGVILLHDCLPTDCIAQYRKQSSRIWNGDVWKALVEARTWPHVDTATCLIDFGVGIICARPNSAPLELAPQDLATMRYEFLASDYQRLLRTVDYPTGLQFAVGDSGA